MSLTLPIQVGKQYVRRDGRVVTAHACAQPGVAIVKIGDMELKREAVYTKNGRWSITSEAHPSDLIADHIPATGHPHAALMAQYAADAAETAEPWLRWQFAERVNDWFGCGKHPEWRAEYIYRRKPKTIRIGEHDVPEPFRGTLAHNQTYWTVSVHAGMFEGFSLHLNSFESTGAKHVASGLVHLTREAAEQHARALLAFTQVQA